MATAMLVSCSIPFIQKKDINNTKIPGNDSSHVLIEQSESKYNSVNCFVPDADIQLYPGNIQYCTGKKDNNFYLLKTDEKEEVCTERGCGSQTKYEEVRLLEYVIESPIFSPDGKQLASIILDPENIEENPRLLPYKAVIFESIDGSVRERVGVPYKVIKSLTFSPDGKQIAFVVVLYDGGSHDVLVVNGKEKVSYSDIRTPIVFSPDSSVIAFEAGEVNPTENRHEYFLVVGNEEIRDGVKRIKNLTFDPDNNIAYVHQDRDGKDTDGEHVVFNSVQRKKYDEVKEVVFSKNGVLAYIGHNRDHPYEEYIVVLNDIELAHHRCSGGGESFPMGFLEKAYASFSPTCAHSLDISNDGTKVTYAFIKGDSNYIYVDGAELGPFSKMIRPQFSSDGKIVRFYADGWQYHVLE